MEQKTISTNNFTLSYDGLFSVRFEYQGKMYHKHIYLSPEVLFEMMLREGYTTKEDVASLDFGQGVHFSKSIVVFEVFEEEDGSISFLTSEEAEHYQGSGHYLINCKIKKTVV